MIMGRVFGCSNGWLPRSLVTSHLQPDLKTRFAGLLLSRESWLNDHPQTQNPENEASDAPEDRAD